MNLDKIRSMSDKDLQEYLRSLSDRKSSNCIKCGKANSNYTINVQNRKKEQHKKLCCLCDECYKDFLEKIDILDIIWD